MRLNAVGFGYSFIILMCIASFNVLAKRNNINRTELTSQDLLSTFAINNPFPMRVFTAQGLRQPTSVLLQGTLAFSSIPHLANLRLANDASNEKNTESQTGILVEQSKDLPKMEIPFVQFNDKIIPINRGLQLTEHSYWDFTIGVGNIWREVQDKNFSRVAMPFTLIEKNQNCVHNGVLSFLIDEQKRTSHFYYQISSETCLYYKVDLWGKGQVDLIADGVPEINTVNSEVIEQYKKEITERMTQQPMERLVAQFPDINLSILALTTAIKPTDMSSFGVLLNGIHYTSQCETRYGYYPFCQQLVLPSYSTAKSIFAGISMMHLAKTYPTLFTEKVSDWVPQCRNETWYGVTFGDLLNMTTGNYHSSAFSVDESSDHILAFFEATSHQDKIHYSCQQFSQKSTPGSTFVYHTSDTYLLGTALNAFLNQQLKDSNPTINIDVFNFIFTEQLWPMLHLSPIAYSTRRTIDIEQQPFTGFGLFFTTDDIAKISQFLMDEQKQKSTFLAANTRNNALQKNQSNNDVHTQYAFIHYNNGFWKRDVTELLQCEKETWLPYMLGYGGISIVLASNELQYYYVSDSDYFFWHNAIAELNKLTPLCRQ